MQVYFQKCECSTHKSNDLYQQGQDYSFAVDMKCVRGHIHIKQHVARDTHIREGALSEHHKNMKCCPEEIDHRQNCSCKINDQSDHSFACFSVVYLMGNGDQCGLGF